MGDIFGFVYNLKATKACSRECTTYSQFQINFDMIILRKLRLSVQNEMIFMYFRQLLCELMSLKASNVTNMYDS